MLAWAAAAQSPGATPPALRRRLSRASVNVILRQDASASLSPMRQQWTEADVLALPGGEHDWFERKAGALYDTNDRSKLLGPLAKGESAFANTGGGSFIIGIEDDGVTFDGLPAMRGGTPMREWIEQMVPNLVAYPLQEFRVHEVVPDLAGSMIPAGQVVLVVDIGDSVGAPHQRDYASSSSTKGIYYMRQGGHSVPARTTTWSWFASASPPRCSRPSCKGCASAPRGPSRARATCSRTSR
jgi:Putative DNA-binding domain